MIRVPGPARVSIDTNGSGRVGSAPSHSGGSCAIQTSRESPRSSKHPSGTTHYGTIAACCGGSGPMPEATYAVRSRYNEEPMKRFRFALLLVVQAFAGGAVSL